MKSLLYIFLLTIVVNHDHKMFHVTNSTVTFSSTTSIEVINAKSNTLQGLIDFNEKTVAFAIPTNSFHGFTNEEQKESFQHDYMESSQFPLSKFIGNFEQHFHSFHKGRPHEVEVQGSLIIHGVEQTRVIKGTLTKNTDKSFHLTTTFTVALDDHNIQVPELFNQRIANEIEVTIDGALAFKE